MTFTYSGDPSDSDQDAVRFEIQDIDTTAPLIQDEEIAYALAQESTVLAASARCCEALARRFAAKADLQVVSGDDQVKRTYSVMAQTFAERAKDLRSRAQGMGLPWHGGGSLSRKDGLRSDTDRVQSTFRRGEFDSPSSGLAAE